MRRYDWAGERGYRPPGRVPYDRIYRSGDAGGHGGRAGGWRQGGSGGYGGYDRALGYAGYDRFGAGERYGRGGEYGGYGRIRGRGRFPAGYRGYDGGYRSHGPSLGRREYDQGWAGGPASTGYDRGYGLNYEPGGGGGGRRFRARGDGERNRGSRGGRGYGGSPGGWWNLPAAASGPGGGPDPATGWTEWSGYSEHWEFPEGYVDEEIENFFDSGDEVSPPWELDEGDWDEPFEDPMPEPPDDDAIRQGVIRSLRSDGFLDSEGIRVEVKDAVVTLRGEVRDYMESRYAWDDAWEAPGVEGVISKLKVGQSAAPAPESNP